MSQEVRIQRRADYGIDAPNVLLGFAIAGVTLSILTGILSNFLSPFQPRFTNVLLGLGVLSAVSCFGFATFMLWGSRIGKFQVRDRLINSIPWRGNEMVLDVGCGHGLLLIGAAKRLTTGKAIGVDIWQEADQSGNRPEATWKNARIEGVIDRIDVKDGDARQLPFADSTFDVVMSNAVLHNIPDKTQRQQAVREMVRVLRPGGRVAISDIWGTGGYAHALKEKGLIEVFESEPIILLFPLARTVTGRKTNSG